jgi:subtilase family serine protease
MKTARCWALTGVAGLLLSMAPLAAASASPRPTSGLSGLQATIRQHEVGAVSKSAPVNFELVLRLRNAAGAQALLKAVSTPGSRSFRHYLTTAQWEARFSPTASAVKSARNWLRSQGFRVGTTSKDRITISASGTAARVEKAFGTGLAYYNVRGQTVRLTTGSASVPASIKGSAVGVVGVMGLNQNIATPAAAAGGAVRTTVSRPSASAVNFPPAPAFFATAPPCGTYYGQKTTTVSPPFGNGYPTTVPDQVCGYKPPQYRSAYGIGSATGKGVTVAIIDAYGSATVASDETRYFSMNDPGNPFANAHFSQLLNSPFNLSAEAEADCAPSGWLTEQAIDVTSVHAMARDANILYVGAKSCFDNDLFTADQQVVDGHLASVMTNSWADTGGDLLDDVATRTAFDNLFLLAGGTGISVLFSTGDDGDDFNLLGISVPNYPSDSPYVTGVGGTTLQIGSKGQQIGQLGWATGRSFKCTANAVNVFPDCTKSTLGTWGPVLYDGGSGGYTSYVYAQPWYQAPVVPTVLADRVFNGAGQVQPARVIPDISMDADPATGLLVGYHQTFPNGKARYFQDRWGGTSLASPLLAGVIADVDGVAEAHGGSAVGFINPAIYRLDTKPGAIDDIVPGGLQAQYRTDHAFTYISPTAKGFVYSFREITFEGTITYCDETGNCASRPNTLSTAKGYDSMTGLGSIGPDFITDLAAP